MADSLPERIRVYSNASGLSHITLGNPVSGYLSFDQIGTGNIPIYYGIVCNLDWEYGSGLYISSGEYITRNKIISSSNNGEKISLFGTSIVYYAINNDTRFLYDQKGVAPSSGYFVTGSGDRFIARQINSIDISGALGYIPYSAENPNLYLSELPETIVYTSGEYVDPEWITYLHPSKVENQYPSWNANKLQGYSISDQSPYPDQLLSWNALNNKWTPKDLNSYIYVLPSGGLEGQIISKTTDTDYDVQWIDNYTPDVRIICKATENISRGDAVMAVGATGDRITIAKAVADGSINPKYMLGVAYENINNEDEGYVTLLGTVTNVDTDVYGLAGTVLWLDPSTAGGFTTTEPDPPNLRMSIAIVTKSQQSSGRIFVRMWTQQPSLHELFDTDIVSPQDGDILSYHSASGVWYNSTHSSIATVVTPTISGTSSDFTLNDIHNGYIIEYSGTPSTGVATLGSISVSGWNCMLVNIGSGIAVASGSNDMYSPGMASGTRTQYSSISIYRRNDGSFMLGGDLA